MKDRKLEKELQARIDFKMGELLEVLENRIGIEWGIAFSGNSQKHEHYWEAFRLLKGMVQKEASMPLPLDEMYEKDFRTKRDKLVNKLEKSLLKRGTGGYSTNLRMIVSVLEDALKF